MGSFVIAADLTQYMMDQRNVPQRRAATPSSSRIIVELVLFVLAYWITGVIGLKLTGSDSASHFWIPTGLSLFVVWIRGYAYLPGVFLGSMLIDISLGYPMLATLLIAIGNVGEAALGVWLLRKFKFNPQLECAWDVLLLTLLPMPLATTLSATMGTFAQWWARDLSFETLVSVFSVWWLGNAVSVVVVAPMLLTWWYWWPSPPAIRTRREVGIAVISFMLAASVVYFLRLAGTRDLLLLLLALPFLTLVSLRYSSRGTTTAIFGVACLIVFGIDFSKNSFDYDGIVSDTNRINVFIGVMAINAMLMCALMRHRVWSEHFLRREHSTFTAAESLAKIGSFQADLKGRIIWWSEEAYRLMGHSPNEPLGDFFGFVQRYIHPDDREEQFKLAERIIRDKVSIKTRFRIITRDGLLKHIDCQGMPSKSPDGKLTDFIGTMQDVTDRVTADEALKSSESRYRLLADHSSDVITRQSVDGAFLYLSPSVINLFGFTPEEMIGRKFDQFVHAEDLPYISKIIAELESIPTTFTFRVAHQDGRFLWVEVSANLIRPSEGPPEVICQFRDVSERKRLEDQMRQSQKMEAVGRLAGGIAHDFNNLLTVINGFSEVLQEMIPEEDPARSLVSDIRDAGLRAATLTKQLLAFSRRQNVTRRAIDLNDALKKSQSLLSRLVGEEVRLKISTSGERAAIMADPAQLDQVLMNLVLNARDAIPGGGEITLGVAQITVVGEGEMGELPPGEFVVLTVSDTGEGIDEATRALIFEPFFSTKEQGKGSGLGLATVYAIMQQADGRITVESEIGKGTSFRLYWPAIESRVAAAKQSDPVISLGDGEVILLVEDDNAVRHLTSRMLRDRGYRVLEAADGLEAIRVCERRGSPVNLIVTDVVMPHMNGREMASHLKRLWPKVPVLYLSGYTNDAIFRRNPGEDSIELLTKPFTAEGLLNKVREMLDAKPIKV